MKTFASTASGPAFTLAAAGEVGVVALALPAEHDVQRVVHVVGPLGGHPRPPSAVGSTIVTSLRSLSAIRSRAAELGREGCRRVGQLGEEVMRGVVGEFVHGVEAQGIDVEVPEPPQHLIDEERSDAVGPGASRLTADPTACGGCR